VLDREGIAGASDATRVAAGRDSGRVAIATRLFEEAVGELAGLSGNYATLVKRNLTGSMGNLRDILGRYQSQLRATAPAGIRDDIPVVAPIGAKLTGPNVGNDATSDLFAFDPVQGSTDPAPSFARAVDINKLPLLARQAGPANGEWVDFAEGDQHINVYDEERLTRAGNADQGAIAAALQDVVRLLANFGPTIPAATEFTAKDATEFIASEATRAFVLMVLGLINTSPSAKKEAASVTVKNIALRVRAVINDLLGNGLGIAATTTKVKPPAWDPQRFKTALATFLSQIESSDLLKALSIFGPHGTPSNFVKQIDSITQKMADARSAIEAFVESRAPAAADATGFQPTFSRAQSGLRHDSSQYMRSPLTASDVQFKTHWDYLWNEEGAVRRIPISLLSDPENPDAIVSPAVQKELSSRLAGAQGSRPIPAPLLPSNGVPSHTQGIDALPIIFNIRQYRKAIHGVNGPNQIDGFEAQARASENYTRSQATAIQYRGDRQLRSLAGNGAVSSKYRVTSVHTAGGDDDDNGPQDMDADRPAFTETFNRAAQRNKRGREAPRSAVAPAINNCINEKLDTEFLTDAFIQNWDELDRHSNLDSVLSVFAKLYLATPTDWRNWQAFLHHNVVFPMNILLARPFIVLHTMFMLKVKAGEDTAITWIARPVTSWGDDAQTQTYRLTLTYYTKTICHNKLNVYRIPNALVSALLSLSRYRCLTLLPPDLWLRARHELRLLHTRVVREDLPRAQRPRLDLCAGRALHLHAAQQPHQPGRQPLVCAVQLCQQPRAQRGVPLLEQVLGQQALGLPELQHRRAHRRALEAQLGRPGAVQPVHVGRPDALLRRHHQRPHVHAGREGLHPQQAHGARHGARLDQRHSLPQGDRRQSGQVQAHLDAPRRRHSTVPGMDHVFCYLLFLLFCLFPLPPHLIKKSPICQTQKDFTDDEAAITTESPLHP
jgi:hypothetical protein